MARSIVPFSPLLSSCGVVTLWLTTAMWFGDSYYWSKHTVKFRNKPRGLYFSKALFEGLIFRGAYIRRGLSTEGNLLFKIDWPSLIVGRKFIVFPLFYFVFEGSFQGQAPGGLYLEGRFHGGFFALRVRGAYIWRGLFSEFYGIFKSDDC